MRRVAAPALPQEGLGWPGGREFVQTTMWCFGFGMLLLRWLRAISGGYQPSAQMEKFLNFGDADR